MLRSWMMASVLVAHTSLGCVPPTADSQDDSAPPRVRLEVDEEERRVDVLVDDDLFTAYLYPDSLEKPTLHPIRTASGLDVTRGFPLDPRPGERVDHPHHVGLWFNYGNVNGIDFWNNSAAIGPERAPRMGRVVHRELRSREDGYGSGVLEITADWVGFAGDPVLRENTRFVFRAGDHERVIDRITTLTALTEPVRFADDKEGLLGLRVARALEQPAGSPTLLTDSLGRPETVPVLDNSGVTGRYVSSEGREGDDVWGTRARWTALRGELGGEPVTVAIIDHPGNAGFPTYWHARGYGLFAANPLGQREFSEGREELDLRLEPGESMTFRHRVLVLSLPFSGDRIDGHARDFAGD
jgi:hypothetical protein